MFQIFECVNLKFKFTNIRQTDYALIFKFDDETNYTKVTFCYNISSILYMCLCITPIRLNV